MSQESLGDGRNPPAHDNKPRRAFILTENTVVYEVATDQTDNRRQEQPAIISVQSHLPVDLKTSILSRVVKWVEISLAVSTFIVVVYYTQAAFIQSTAALKSANAAVTAATVAAQSLDNSKEAFRIEQRPYLVLDGEPAFLNAPSADKPIQANVTIRNIGKTAALRYTMHVKLAKFLAEAQDAATRKKYRRFIISEFDGLYKQDAAQHKELLALPSWVETDLAPNAPTFTTSNNPVSVSSSELSELMSDSGKVILVYIGTLNYTDALGGKYRTEFCSYYFGSNVQVWHNCDSHNIIR